MKADLHSHTVLSDGALNVDQLISQAKRVGLDYIAVTDHNSTHSIPAVLALGKELGINVIPGVEINSVHEASDTKPHLLCYYPADVKKLQRKLDRYLEYQRQTKLAMYEKIMEDYPITKEQLFEAARESTTLYEVHMMQVLASLGYTGTPIGELHQELFSSGSKYKLTQKDLTTHEAVGLIRSCGGVVGLAHPGEYKNPMLMEMLIEEKLIDGIELNHPRNDERTKDHVRSLAKEHDLFMTGGTDFHGIYTKTPYPIGSFLCPEEGLERLIAAGKEANDSYLHSSRHDDADTADEKEAGIPE